MNIKHGIAIALALLGCSSVADAAMPVIDIAAVRSLGQQVSAWHSQLSAMQLQLSQLQQTRVALTGRRGMERLLPIPITARNYLPADSGGLASVAQGASGSHGALASAVAAQIGANAVLSPAELRRLPPAIAARIEQARRDIALAQSAARAAYARSSDRFTELGALLDGIAAAPDAKAIADLQGRIGVEQAMLDNERIKLAALAQIADADRSAREQQLREAITENHGAFASRFQPTLPVP